MAVDLKNHPGLNPEYFSKMEERQQALSTNRAERRAFAMAGMDPRLAKTIPVPKQPNKYVPHIGAKQLAKMDGAK